MNLPQLLFFTWMGCWVLFDVFVPEIDRAQKIQYSTIVTASMAFYFNAHGAFYSKLKNIFKKKS